MFLSSSGKVLTMIRNIRLTSNKYFSLCRMEVHDLEIQISSQRDTENTCVETKAHTGDSKLGGGETLNIMLNGQQLKEMGVAQQRDRTEG